MSETVTPLVERPVLPLRPSTPSVDDVSLADLHVQEEIAVRTDDGWTLVLTRYRPQPQPFPQPLFGVPLLLVHGYTQNRRAWSTGEFVKSMLYFGADLFLLELRGHGKSGIDAQRRAARESGGELPEDLDYLWDLDSHLLFDLPAAVREVKRASGRERIFYCGHSLGGILGYAYATLFDDLQGLITIGSPSDFARLPPWLRLLAWAPPFAFPAVDVAIAAANVARLGARALQRIPGMRPPRRAFTPWRFRRLPFREAFRWLGENMQSSVHAPLTGRIPFSRPLLYQRHNVALSALRPLFREGSTDEPRATLEQLARWARRGELTSPRLAHDIAAAFPRIRIPLAIFFGDEDPLASVRTTRNVYRAASSEYLLWRPVRGNSHLELTMGYDIRQICYDVKNLMSYALDHEHGNHSLPRRRRGRAS